MSDGQDRNPGIGDTQDAPRLLTLLAIAVVAAALWALFFHSNFTYLWAPDAMKFAQAARNFLEGAGFDRDEVWPMSLATGGDLDARTHAFLHPLVVAILFLLAGQSDSVAALASGLFFILSAPLVYYLGRRLFSMSAGVLATAIFLCEPWALYYSVSGLSESLFTFLLLAFFAAIVPCEKGVGLPRYLLAGAILALCYLARPVAMVFVPAVLIYTYFDGGIGLRRFVKPAVVLAAFVCTVVVLLVLFGALSDIGSERNSFHLITNTPEYPGHAYVRSISPVPFWDHLTAYPEAHLSKWARQLNVMGHGFFEGLANPLATALFLTFPLIWGRGGRALRLFVLLAGLIVLQVGLAALTMPATRYLHPFIPLVLVFASASLMVGLRRLLPGRSGLRALTLVLAVACVSYPFAYTAPLDREGIISRDYSDVFGAKDYSSLGDFIQERTEEDDVVFCDAPWIVAWYGNRTSIWLPNSPRDMEFLKMVSGADWLFLTEEYRLPRAWQLFFEGIAAGREDKDWEFVLGIEDERTRGHLFRARSDD